MLNMDCEYQMPRPSNFANQSPQIQMNYDEEFQQHERIQAFKQFQAALVANQQRELLHQQQVQVQLQQQQQQQQQLQQQQIVYRGSPQYVNKLPKSNASVRTSNSSSSSASRSPAMPPMPQIKRVAPGKAKRIRTIFTPEQLRRLEQEFNHQMYLVGDDRGSLAHSLGLSESQVKVWFQNRRIKHRKTKDRISNSQLNN